MAPLFFNFITLFVIISRFGHVLIGRMIATTQVSSTALLVHASLLIEGNRLGAHLGVQTSN